MENIVNSCDNNSYVGPRWVQGQYSKGVFPLGPGNISFRSSPQDLGWAIFQNPGNWASERVTYN